MTGRIQLVTAQPAGDDLKLLVTIDGKVTAFVISRSAVASAVGNLAKALSEKS